MGKEQVQQLVQDPEFRGLSEDEQIALMERVAQDDPRSQMPPTQSSPSFMEPISHAIESYNRNIGDPFRGLLAAPFTGGYKPTTGADLFGAEQALEERGPLAATIRKTAGDFVDPLALAPLVTGLPGFMRGVKEGPPAVTRLMPNIGAPPTTVTGPAGAIPGGSPLGAVPNLLREALTPLGSRVEAPRTVAGDVIGDVGQMRLDAPQMPSLVGQNYDDILQGPLKPPSGTLPPAAVDITRDTGLWSKENALRQQAEVNQWYSQYQDQFVKPTLGDSPIIPPEVKKLNERGLYSKIFGDAISNLAGVHPVGREAANLWLKVRDQVEQQTVQGLNSWERQMDKIFGARQMFSRQQLNPMSHYETQGMWNLSKDEMDEMVNYIYSSGRVKPKGAEQLESAPFSLESIHAKKIMEAGDAFFAATRDASSHPGVRELEVFDKLTGEWKPMGEPNMFFPQIPVSEKALQLQGRAFNEAFTRWREHNPNGTHSEFKRALHSRSGDVRGYAGLEMGRLFDAEAVAKAEGTTIAQTLRKHGYVSDPRQALFNYLYGAYGAGERKLAEPIWKHHENQLQVMTHDPDEQKWLSKMFSHMRGTDTETMDRMYGGTVSAFNNLTNAGLLQYSMPMQMNQVVYAIERGGLGNTMKAVRDMFKGEDISGPAAASFADLLATLSPSRGVNLTVPFTGLKIDMNFAKLLQSELTVTGFTGMDDVLRIGAGKIGDNYAQSLAQRLKLEPGNVSVRAQMTELGLNPERVLGQGGELTYTDRLTAAKRFADESQGRRDLRGLPLWANENSNTKRMLLNLKNFMLINEATFKRDVIDAVSNGVGKKEALARFARHTGGSVLMGEFTKDIVHGITTLEGPDTRQPPKAIAKVIGPEWARAAEDYFIGRSSMMMAIVMSLAQQKELALLELVAPVGVVMAAKMWENPGKAATRLLGGPTAAHQYFPPKKKGGIPNLDRGPALSGFGEEQ
jgi:hypothetical protein